MELRDTYHKQMVYFDSCLQCEGMVDDGIERVLWWWTIPELLLFLLLFVFLSASLLGYSGLFTTYPSSIRLFGLIFALFQLAVPIWVYYDLQTHSDSPDLLWFHIAAMPAINLIGMIGYLNKRNTT